MVLLPGCNCCASCYPPAGNLEIDVTQSSVADCSALVEFNNNGYITQIPLFGQSTDLSGTYSIPAGGTYGNPWFQLQYLGYFISASSTSRTLLQFNVVPNFNDGSTTICNYTYYSNVFRDCNINTLEKSYAGSAPFTYPYQNCGAYVIAGGGTLAASPCGTPFDIVFQPRVKFIRPASQSYSILSNTFPFSSVEVVATSRVFTFGFDWSVRVTAARIVNGLLVAPWFNDGGADCVA